MEINREQLPDGVEKIAIAGRMDSAGAHEIDLRFTALTATRSALIVLDFSEVSFLASLGIRMLISSAKAQSQRGGRMVLAKPQPLVDEVLKVTGIDALIPVYADIESACAALKTAATNG